MRRQGSRALVRPAVTWKSIGPAPPLLAKCLVSGDKFRRDYVCTDGRCASNLLSWCMAADDVSQQTLAGFGRKYLWWEPVGGQPHSEDRIIAQTMNLGTYDDILMLERMVGKSRLVEIMLRAQPGWISDRSWEFWRGRLSFATGAAIPDRAPRRARRPACAAKRNLDQLGAGLPI
jgi:hypothetical protein